MAKTKQSNDVTDDVTTKRQKKSTGAGKTTSSKTTTKGKAKSAGNKSTIRKSRIYQTPAEMEKVIDDYFESLLTPMVVYDKTVKDRVIVWKDADKKIPYMETVKPPTILGMCEYLGISIQSLSQTYETKEEYVDVITRARSKIERHWVELLVEKDSQRGAEFYLRCKHKYITIDAEQSLAIQREGLELQKQSLLLQESKVKGIEADVGKINSDIQTLKDIITNPAPNRTLSEYE